MCLESINVKILKFVHGEQKLSSLEMESFKQLLDFTRAHNLVPLSNITNTHHFPVKKDLLFAYLSQLL
jgi:hypothetical protein